MAKKLISIEKKCCNFSQHWMILEENYLLSSFYNWYRRIRGGCLLPWYFFKFLQESRGLPIIFIKIQTIRQAANRDSCIGLKVNYHLDSKHGWSSRRWANIRRASPCRIPKEALVDSYVISYHRFPYTSLDTIPKRCQSCRKYLIR